MPCWRRCPPLPADPQYPPLRLLRGCRCGGGGAQGGFDAAADDSDEGGDPAARRPSAAGARWPAGAGAGVAGQGSAVRQPALA
jgi:hypothetical protein